LPSGISRLGLSFIQDALSEFCVLGGFFIERASDPSLEVASALACRSARCKIAIRG
jgi:hypothetical protein